MIRDRDILYVTHRFPYPPTGGAKVRAYHCIARLAEHNRVTVAAPTRDDEERAAAADLAATGPDVLTAPIAPSRAVAQSLAGVATGRTASLGYFRSPELVRRIRARIADRRPDLIVVHCSSVGPYVADVADIPKVLDFVDMDSRKWLDYARFKPFPLSLAYRREGRRLAAVEARLARAFDLSLLATRFEQETLEEIAGPAPSAVVRNGVDADVFSPGEADYDPDLLCFVGRMDYYPNEQAMVDFCRETFPLIRSRRPAARLAIVGAAPGPAVRRLASLEGVTVTGTVDDVRPWVRSAALTVVPLTIARGTQNKILESMAMGVPVVASPVAGRGVDAAPGTHLRVADGAAETARAALDIMGRPEERARLAAAGREWIEQRYTWSTTLADFDAALSTLLENRARSPA